MKPILIFSGTTEGRKLAELLSGREVSATVCVATEYGSQVMESLPGITIRQGRMSVVKMQEMMDSFTVVVDATHPFATKVSEHIRQSAEKTGILYLRLQRDTRHGKQDVRWGVESAHRSESDNNKGEFYFSSHQECADSLSHTTGNILLTTGSKELSAYCRNENIREKLFVRILPSEESIAACREHGLKGKQIIAMQGPFSREMNLALFHQYEIRHMVTKESGDTGGFWEKISAAGQAGVLVSVIGNPEKEQGLSFGEVCRELERITGICLKKERQIHLSLLGIGMGGRDTLTMAAKEKLDASDYLFGAKRMLACVKKWKTGKKVREEYPFYRAEDIIPVLEKIAGDDEGEIADRNTIEVSVLFSGDSGFYSGCQKVYQKLSEWKETRKEKISIRIYPGISSVSYFASVLGISWQDAKIISIHGRGEKKEWEAEILSAVKYQKKVFLLVSGAADVRMAGKLLLEAHLTDCRVMVGYQLSYPEEKIMECTPKQCGETEREGLYVLCILQENPKERFLAPQKKDSEFIRGKVPMTKEEIRALAVCKLKLTESAVVYDIGSGTGSVAAEIAEQSEKIQVYAVEQKEEGIELIQKNRKKFELQNLKVIQGRAPDALRPLPAPTHVFIGGSEGELKEILEVLCQKTPRIRIVMTAVTLETVSEIREITGKMQTEDVEIIQLQVSRVAKTGKYHLMKAENPVFLASFWMNGSEGGEKWHQGS